MSKHYGQCKIPYYVGFKFPLSLVNNLKHSKKQQHRQQQQQNILHLSNEELSDLCQKCGVVYLCAI